MTISKLMSKSTLTLRYTYLMLYFADLDPPRVPSRNSWYRGPNKRPSNVPKGTAGINCSLKGRQAAGRREKKTVGGNYSLFAT